MADDEVRRINNVIANCVLVWVPPDLFGMQDDFDEDADIPVLWREKQRIPVAIPRNMIEHVDQPIEHWQGIPRWLKERTNAGALLGGAEPMREARRRWAADRNLFDVIIVSPGLTHRVHFLASHPDLMAKSLRFVRVNRSGVVRELVPNRPGHQPHFTEHTWGQLDPINVNLAFPRRLNNWEATTAAIQEIPIFEVPDEEAPAEAVADEQVPAEVVANEQVPALEAPDDEEQAFEQRMMSLLNNFSLVWVTPNYFPGLDVGNNHWTQEFHCIPVAIPNPLMDGEWPENTRIPQSLRNSRDDNDLPSMIDMIANWHVDRDTFFVVVMNVQSPNYLHMFQHLPNGAMLIALRFLAVEANGNISQIVPSPLFNIFQNGNNPGGYMIQPDALAQIDPFRYQFN